jgi:hypothetical protein
MRTHYLDRAPLANSYVAGYIQTAMFSGEENYDRKRASWPLNMRLEIFAIWSIEGTLEKYPVRHPLCTAARYI